MTENGKIDTNSAGEPQSVPEKLASEPIQESSAPEPKEEASPPAGDPPAAKRGRLIVAGLVAAAVVSVICAVVAGIFHLTNFLCLKWCDEKPTDAHAQLLWSKTVSEQIQPAGRAVPPGLANASVFRGLEESPNSAEQK
jgi:hypothetical protein